MSYKPDEHKIHTYEINEIEGPKKTFNSKEGTKEVYILRFKEHGYEAEFCPLIGVFAGLDLKPGKRFTFKIIYRKEYKDEIAPATIEHSAETIPGAPRVYSMSGHPAYLALRAAVDLKTAEATLMPKGKDSKILVSDVLGEADTILDWLNKKAAGEE